jgi:hypothetical protein
MSGALSPTVLFYTFCVFSLTSIIFTIIYLSTLSPKVITQGNIISYYGWLIVGVISMLIMRQIYVNNITYNVTLIVTLYVLYAFSSLINLSYFYKIMMDGRSFNNNTINNYRMVIGILNIVIMVLFIFSVYKDNSTLSNSSLPYPSVNKLVIGNIAITFMYLVCIMASMILLYKTSSGIKTYSITDG